MSSGEVNLGILLHDMKPELQCGEYVFCTAGDAHIREIDCALVGAFHEAEGLTLIVARTEADRLNMNYSHIARMITLTVHSSLNAVGFLATITDRLAAHNISTNVISAYYHDHLFVPVDRAEEALAILEDITHRAQTATAPPR